MTLLEELELYSTLSDSYLVAFGHEKHWTTYKQEIENEILAGSLSTATTKLAQLKEAYDKLTAEIIIEKQLREVKENMETGVAEVNTTVASIVDFDGMKVGKVEKIIERIGNVLLLVSLGELASAKRVLLEVKTDRTFTNEMRDEIASRL